MRLFRLIFLFIGFLMPVFAQRLCAQNVQQNLQPQQVTPANSIPLQEALNRIKELYKVSFLFAQKNIDNKYTIADPDKKQPVEELLDEILLPNNLLYKKIAKDYYSIFPEGDVAKSTTGILQGRFTISGVVTDEKGERLPGTIVFVSGSKHITAANANGEFRLEGLPPGNYEVVAKMIGFENFKQDIIIDQQPALVNIVLHMSNTVLDEVTIISPENRRRFLETFKRYFIGQSANAAKCTILNPDVLNFRYQKDNNTLYANADDFLVIENSGLGYRLKYLLNKFEFNYKTEILYYRGSPYFEELEGSEKVKKEWQKNREVAYNGSVMDFFRAVFNNTLKERGYEVYDTTLVTKAQIVNKNSLWNITYVNEGFAYIKPKTKLSVLYGKENSGAYTKKFVFGQSSYLKPLLDSVLIDRNGSFASTGFLFSGYWSWETVAEMLPVDYKMNNHQVVWQSGPAQNKTALSATTRLVSAIDSFAVRMPVEKVYLHIDKPYYTNTDTIWLKAYVLNGELAGSQQSGLLYTELVNDTGRVVLRQAMPVRLGISWGQIALDSLQVAEGSYTLRAYTNWMQNIGEAGFFTRQLYISKSDESAWLVKAGYKAALKNGKENTEIALQLLGQDDDPVRLQDIQLKLTEGSKTRFREKMQTDIEGRLNFNFDVPPKAGRLKLVAEGRSNSGSSRIVLPLNLDREVNADVQFMPEGGSLVAGLVSKIGFIAVGEDGKGIAIRGVVLDSKSREVAAFQSLYKGIGSFIFTPTINELYTAKVTFPKGLVKSYTLSVTKPSGVALMVNNIPGRDSIILAIQATADIVNAGSSYSLIAQSGGKVCFASTVSFKGSDIINGRVAKSRFPTGVVRFTLFSNTGQPVAGRIIFIDHHDRLTISLNTDKQSYQPKDSVSLNIIVTDKENKPVQGSFSLAVTDDSQVKADSTNIPDINSYMLLQSELKGNIEEPGYYFSRQTPETEQNLDNLLLTQGWVAYDWKDVFDKPTDAKYKAEKEIIEVSGTVKRLSKPQAGLKVNLLSMKKGLVFRDTLTGAGGKFNFDNLPRTDTPSYLVQVKDKRGKMFEANIYMDEFTPAGTGQLAVPNLMPWYINSDSTLLNYNRQHIALEKEMERLKYPAGANMLKEVRIKGKKKIKGSKFFAGAGAEPDQVIDEADMIKAGRMTLEDVLIKNVKGFTGRPYPCRMPAKMEYTVNCSLVSISLDGVSIDWAYNPGVETFYTHYMYLRSVLQTIVAEDVRGIELKSHRSSPDGLSIVEITNIEITTWSGNGAFMKRTHNRALYRPMPLTWPKQFYKPKYTAKPDALFDLRSTVHWQPDIITDEQGKATVSFYTKSKKAAYTVIIQGADMTGLTGYKKAAITIKK